VGDGEIVNGRGGKGAARVIGDQRCEVGGARASDSRLACGDAGLPPSLPEL